MSTATFGTNAVDWEERIYFDRLRTERLARLKAELERSELGAVLAFDFSNIRYMSATHIGTWAMDKLIRFALLDPELRPDRLGLRLGGASTTSSTTRGWPPRPPRWTPTRTPRTTAPSGRARESGARAGISTLRGAFHPDAGIAEEVARKIKRELEKFGLLDEPLGVDVIELPDPVRAAAGGHRRRRRPAGVPRGPPDQDRATRSRLLTQAASMVDAAYDELYEFLRPGVRENEAVGLVSKTLYDLGSEYVEGVNAISGERCSPHPHVYSDRIIRPGDPAFFDILHSYNGYRTCYYRTFAVGSASTAQRDAYTRAREYMDRAIALVQARRHHRRHRQGVADRPGVRLPRRGGGVRPAVRPRRRAVDLGEADLLAAGLARPPRGARRRACSSRSRPTGPPPTGSAPRASRRSSWSPRTAARWSPSSRPRSCSSPASATSPSAARCPSLRSSQSHLNTACGAR